MKEISTKGANIFQAEKSRRVIENLVWLIADKFLRLFVGVSVIVYMARYLGPTQFGLLNFGLAIVAVFIALASLGLNSIVIRDLISVRVEAHLTTGTSALLILVASVLMYFFSIIGTLVLRPNDGATLAVVIVLGLSILLQPSQVVRYWFEARIQSKYVVWVDNSAFIIFSALKLASIQLGLSLIAFAWLFLFESLFVAVGLLVIYSKKAKDLSKWRFELSEAVTLLKDSWPLIVSAGSYILYMRVDQIMIGRMLGDAAVGYYSAAIKLSEVANFVPAVIAASVLPAILIYRESNRALYLKSFQHLYDGCVFLMLSLAVVVTYFSDLITRLFFGSAYESSSTILALHIWSGVFVGIAVISGRYFVNEGLQKITMWRHLAGLVINIPLNIILIRLAGINGAAIATLMSLIVSNYILDFFAKETRTVFIQKTKAIFMISLFGYIYKAIRIRF